MHLLNKSDLPNGFEYPLEFAKIIKQGIVDLDPWVILDGDHLKDRFIGLKERYKRRTLIPFARRLEDDDLACWDTSMDAKVVIIHDFASEGWEERKIFDTFWDWFRSAVDDMIEHDL